MGSLVVLRTWTVLVIYGKILAAAATTTTTTITTTTTTTAMTRTTTTTTAIRIDNQENQHNMTDNQQHAAVTRQTSSGPLVDGGAEVGPNVPPRRGGFARAFLPFLGKSKSPRASPGAVPRPSATVSGGEAFPRTWSVGGCGLMQRHAKAFVHH